MKRLRVIGEVVVGQIAGKEQQWICSFRMEVGILLNGISYLYTYMYSFDLIGYLRNCITRRGHLILIPSQFSAGYRKPNNM